MRFRTSMSVTLCAFAVGLGAVACSPSDPASSPAGSATTSAANRSATEQAGKASAAPPSQAAASVGRCQPANLSFTLGAMVGATSTTQPAQVVDMTNKGSSACTMEGFPGVNLVGASGGQDNYTWPLARASASYASQSQQGISEVTLRPGGTAHFELRYLPGATGDGNRLINVTKMVITPPNDYNQAELTWHQDVILQDAATHPGTYLMPVVSGS
jgi:hypothetical protein